MSRVTEHNAQIQALVDSINHGPIAEERRHTDAYIAKNAQRLAKFKEEVSKLCEKQKPAVTRLTRTESEGLDVLENLESEQDQREGTSMDVISRRASYLSLSFERYRLNKMYILLFC